MKQNYFSKNRANGEPDFRFGENPKSLVIGDHRFAPRYEEQRATLKIISKAPRCTAGFGLGPLFEGSAKEYVPYTASSQKDDSHKVAAQEKRKSFTWRSDLKLFEKRGGAYFLTDGEYCRVGSSGNVRQRLAMHCGGYPKPLRLLKAWYGSLVLENFLKALLEDYYVNGEWFYLPSHVIDAVCRINSAEDIGGLQNVGKLIGIDVRLESR